VSDLQTQELSLQIDRVGSEGQGVGADSQGNVYFVAGSVPGDKVRVLYRPTPRPVKYRDAELVAIEAPSASRHPSACQYFPECGGCDWLNWDYAEQLKAKESIVTHSLSKLGWVPQVRLPIVPAEQVLGYRTRIQVSRDGDRLGFYRRGTRSVVNVDHCAIARPELNALMTELRQEPNSGRAREELFIDTSGKAHRRSIDMYGLDFAQIHEAQNEKLRKMVADLIGQSQARTIIELFCGNGNLTFAYGERAEKIWAVDSSQRSIERANQAALAKGWERKAEFQVRNVGYALRHRLPAELSNSYDTLVLDPPRQGIGDSLREWVSKNLKNIFYVSCSPITFAQDITHIRDLYSLKSLQTIDMFPQTRHVEVVGWLQRHS
jgi:23S rRNA (uracil1939-C5)-methyltransferase